MADQDEDIEFLPTDELVETEPAGAEDDAVHVQDGDELEELEELDAATSAEEPGAGAPEKADGESLDVETRAAPDDEERAEDAAGAEEHEDDLQEVLRRHYGIVEEQPDEDATRDETAELRDLSPEEFVCRSCFMRRSASQLADAPHGICVDCAADLAG